MDVLAQQTEGDTTANLDNDKITKECTFPVEFKPCGDQCMSGTPIIHADARHNAVNDTGDRTIPIGLAGSTERLIGRWITMAQSDKMVNTISTQQ